MDDAKRTTISVIVALIVVAIVYFLVPATPITPKGIFLPSGKSIGASHVSADRIRFFTQATTPAAYRAVGYINVQYHAPRSTPEGQALVLQTVKSLAAQAGATGIIVNVFGHTLAGSVGSAQASYAFMGKAIR